MDPMSDEFQKNVKKVQKLAESTLVEHKAYLLADAAAKDLEIEKYRRQIMEEMKKDNLEEEQDEVFSSFCGIIDHFVDTIGRKFNAEHFTMTNTNFEFFSI